MKNILVVSGHTDLKNNSVANRAILDELEAKLQNVEFDYLDTLYPDYKIDVAAEQAKLINADVIVLQYPVWWYHFPALMQKWMEDTFQHGFSHGSTGDKLKGKKLIASLTTGAPEALYHKGAPMGYEIEAFLPPIKAICNLCGMEFAGFVYTGGVSYQSRDDAEKLAEMKEKSAAHASRVVALIDTL